MVEGMSEKIGAIIVKGTFQDMDAPNAVSKEAQEKIFLKDVPFNFVRNSDFEASGIKPWHTAGGTTTLESNGVKRGQFIGLTPIPARLKQTISFDNPLGGRTFILSFYAKVEAEKPVNIDGFLLRASKTGAVICSFSAILSKDFQKEAFISSPGTWPPELKDTEMDVTLAGPNDPAIPVYFDRVQVEESTAATRWDEDTVFRYEHDLVPFKPYADVIVLGDAEPPNGDRSKLWQFVLETGTGIKMKKSYQPDDFPTKTIFGWAVRGETPRLEQAGDTNNFDPKTMNLPKDFQNLFYNGFDRTTEFLDDNDKPFQPIGLPYLNDGMKLTIRSERPNADPPIVKSFEVRLPASRPSAVLTKLDEAGQRVVKKVSLALDTLIIEPKSDRYMVVWRGFWPFNIKETYLELAVVGGV